LQLLLFEELSDDGDAEEFFHAAAQYSNGILSLSVKNALSDPDA
jgi:hypothetical protein